MLCLNRNQTKHITGLTPKSICVARYIICSNKFYVLPWKKYLFKISLFTKHQSCTRNFIFSFNKLWLDWQYTEWVFTMLKITLFGTITYENNVFLRMRCMYVHRMKKKKIKFQSNLLFILFLELDCIGYLFFLFFRMYYFE